MKNPLAHHFIIITRPSLQLCQAPGLDKEKEWSSKKMEFRLVKLEFEATN